MSSRVSPRAFARTESEAPEAGASSAAMLMRRRSPGQMQRAVMEQSP
jgi:hypothetical protein